jgi:hypothetical protein
MILGLGLTGGLGAFYDHHPTAARILLLAAIFVLGCVLAFGGQRDLACVDWFFVLAVVTVWIGYPLTTLRICIGAAVFLFGLTLLVVYYRGRARSR